MTDEWDRIKVNLDEPEWRRIARARAEAYRLAHEIWDAESPEKKQREAYLEREIAKITNEIATRYRTELSRPSPNLYREALLDIHLSKNDPTRLHILKRAIEYLRNLGR